VVLKRNSQRFFSADFHCVSASHHFALFFFETGSLEGFVVLEIPRYFFAARQKIGLFAAAMVTPMAVAMAAANATATAATTAVAAAMATASDSCVEGIFVVDAAEGR
jgi:hypothetical protein